MIKITVTVTADDPFNEPWPPSSTDNWHVVRCARGFTLWRSIRIVQQPEPALTTANGRRWGHLVTAWEVQR
jgi:hypothetical protein